MFHAVPYLNYYTSTANLIVINIFFYSCLLFLNRFKSILWYIITILL